MKRLAFALALSLLPLPAAACKLALVLAIDISNSVDGREYSMQTDGLANALVDPVVREALVRGRMAIAVVLWSGPNIQHVVIPWRRMENDGDVVETATAVQNLRRVHAQSNTAIGAAVAFARNLFDQVPDCARRTIDVSGDGLDNAGTHPDVQRDVAYATGITINGLAIDKNDNAVTQFFKDNLITPNGFVMTSQGHESYADTLRRKMRREVGEAMS